MIMDNESIDIGLTLDWSKERDSCASLKISSYAFIPQTKWRLN